MGSQYSKVEKNTHPEDTIVLIQWDTYMYRCFSIQTLVNLNLQNNQVTDSGAQYLAEALKTNTVKIIGFSRVSLIFSLFIFVEAAVLTASE